MTMRHWMLICEQQGQLPLTPNGLLYHTSSASGAYDILKQRVIRGGNHEADPFVSFSEIPLLNNPDIAAAEVCIGFSASAFAGQVDRVEYTEEWYRANRERAAYIAGEGWYHQWQAPDDAYDEEGFEDEDVYAAAHDEAQFDAFMDKENEREWVSQSRDVIFQPNAVHIMIVKDISDWPATLAALGYRHVQVRQL